MTRFSATFASLLLLLAPLAQARSGFHLQAEEALARSFNEFYTAVAAQPNISRAQIQGLQQQMIQPVVSNYDRMIAGSWQTAVNKRLDEATRLNESSAPTSNPFLAKILGRLGFGSGGDGGLAGDSGNGKSDGSSGGPTPRAAEDKVIIDGTDVPKFLEYPDPKKKKNPAAAPSRSH